MKRNAMTGFVLSFFIAATAQAQSGGMKGMDMKDMPMKGMDMKTDKKGAKGTVHKATGVVTKVEKNKVTIKHEPVRSMDWPSMTMAFAVKDKALINRLGKDKKVDFEFRQEGRDYVITAVK
jgi:Cu(I)/Ag(I) efflux system periplasmic protein CusF